MTFLAVTVTAPAAAQNFPPRARVSASTVEALVGESVTLDARASIDPDEGPMPLTYRWELGDGTVAEGPVVLHGYDAAGLYSIRVIVSDGVSESVAGVEVGVVPAPSAVLARASATIALTPQALFVANEDSGSMSRLELSDGSVRERSVCAAPTSLAVVNGVVHLTCESGELLRVDADSLDVRTRTEVGLGARGLVSLSGDRVLVALESERALAIVDGADVQRVPLEIAPHAVAVDGNGAEAWVTSLRSSGEFGRVVRVELAPRTVAEVALAVDPGPDTSTSGRGIPNVLAAIAIDPRGDTVWVGGIKQNTGRGLFVSGEPLDTRSRLRGVLLPVDRSSGGDLVSGRLDTNDADAVSGIAFSPRGRFAYLTHQGAGSLSVYDLLRFADADRTSTDAFPFEARIDVGDAPGSVVLNAAGDRAYVHARLSRAVVVLDLGDSRGPVEVDRIPVTEEPLPSLVAEGKRLFHRSRAPVHSDQSYIACASCHPDGGHDGRTWDFTQFGEGLRNTIDLRGRAGLAHGPLHWSANFDEVQDFENDIVASFGGTGLAGDGDPPHPPLGEPNGGRSRALDALAAYVSSLGRVPRSPFRAADGSLTAEALRGKAIFHDPRSACATCHAPPRFTDSGSELHDVGTLGAGSGGRLGGPLEGMDTPTLLGLWDTAPYLHDGSAPTLDGVLDRNTEDRHGRTSHLSDAQRSDLVAFLLSLDGSDDELPAVPMNDAGTGGAPSVGGGGCSGCSVERARPTPALLLALLLVWRRRGERILTYTERRAGACRESRRVGRVDP
ncbi:MAG: PKD domain-containing protein [Deltaproteobacteria bacterium]|nr:PKD domain-containing protein [Deltaproteobacteria bacterium]